MTDIAAILVVILFPALMIIIAIYLFTLSRFFRELKDYEPDVWSRLGSPSLIMNNSISNNIKFLGFLFRNEYMNLKQELVSEAKYIKKLLYTATILFPLTVVLVLMVLLSNGT
jgi:predicted PurR-regulated permease PerM